MNKDSKAIDDFLAWLLQDPNPIISAPSGEPYHQGNPDEFRDVDLQRHFIDPLDSEDLGTSLTEIAESNRFSFSKGKGSLFNLGDITAVQDRFHSLLKRRLRAEIERHPPLFPWETELLEYEAECSDRVAPEAIPTRLWLTHLQTLNLPVPMPEAILAQLLTKCQEVVQLSLQEGAKIVQVVENLFPGQAQPLNQLAGMVLASPARSGQLTETLRTNRPDSFPGDYAAASPPQQMLLSLLAAHEILDSLTLSVSPDQSQVKRQWQTDAGQLTVEAFYGATGALRIQGHLPCGGRLRLQGDDVESTAQRANPGYLSVELFDLVPDVTYPLEVQLTNTEQASLTFAIRPTTASTH